MNFALLFALAWRFSLFSLMTIGGVNSLLPEIHRQVVDNCHWMSNAEFSTLFAIAQAAPGPNMLFVTLIGWKVAGLAGALVTTICLCLPSSLLTYYMVRLRERFSDSPWRMIIEQGLAPVTIGLTLGSGVLLMLTTDLHGISWVLSAVTIVLTLKTRINPLCLLAGGALLGLTGWF
jgi:chromate transporter